VTSSDNKDNARRVWAIVLMYGDAAVTAECIDALLLQDYPALTVLLVDNASPDAAGVQLHERYPGIHYLDTGSNFGYAGGNNRGLSYALEHGAEFVLIVNNDAILDRRCISLLVQTAEQVDRAGAVSPKILSYAAPERIAFAGGDFSLIRALGLHRRAGQVDDPSEPPRVDEITFVTGACVLIPAPVLRELGGFREDFFMYCEDVELSVRMRRAGYRMYYQPAARVRHHEPPSGTLSYPFAAFHRDRNRRRLARAHYTPLQRLLFASWFYPTRLVRMGQYLLRGDWRGVRAIAAGAIRR
jgi:GT2 family glycosyltransferase